MDIRTGFTKKSFIIRVSGPAKIPDPVIHHIGCQIVQTISISGC